MANSLFAGGREDFALGNIDWVGDTIAAQLVDIANYVVDLSAHDFFDDVPVSARVGPLTTLAGRVAPGGVCDADNLTVPGVSGATVEALVIIKNTGSAATSRLIAYIHEATGLPATPNGTDIDVIWDNGANKIFKL